MFSKTCKYGLRAIIYIAQQSLANKKIGLKTIAKEIDSPEAFTAKILQKLSQKKIIKSTKGPYGGFYIENKDLNNIKLKTIVNIFDGDEVFCGCGLGLSKCDDSKPCPIHNNYTRIKKEMLVLLNYYNLKEIINNNYTHKLILKR